MEFIKKLIVYTLVGIVAVFITPFFVALLPLATFALLGNLIVTIFEETGNNYDRDYDDD